MPPIERDEKKVAYKRGKRRVAAKQPSPAQCLEWLSRSNLHGVLCRNAVWLACTRQLAYFLERVCLGRRAPPEAAAGVPVFVNALGVVGARDAETRPVVVRLSPEEAFYMVHRMDCLVVHGVERGVPPGEPVPDPMESAGGESAPGGDGRTWLMRLSRTELWRALARFHARRRPNEGAAADAADDDRPLADVVYVDVGGLSGDDGILEALALLAGLGTAIEPRAIVIKSACTRKLASQLRSFTEMWLKQRAR